MVVSVGSGTAEPLTSKGIAIIRGEGEMWTQSLKLTNLNGAKWTCERESNLKKGKSVIHVDIQEME